MKTPKENQDENPVNKKMGDCGDPEDENEILKNFHEQQKKYAEVKTTRRGKGKIFYVHSKKLYSA